MITASVFEREKMVKPARLALLQNGLLVDQKPEIDRVTHHWQFCPKEQVDFVCPIGLPAHYCPVHLHNLWVGTLCHSHETDNQTHASIISRYEKNSFIHMYS